MAIKLQDEYPGQVLTGQGGWPHGKPKNQSSAGSGDGTPFEAAWMSDLHGFLQALLDDAGVSPDGNPDRVAASQYLEAIKAIFPANTGGTFNPSSELEIGGQGLRVSGDFWVDGEGNITGDITFHGTSDFDGPVNLNAAVTIDSQGSLQVDCNSTWTGVPNFNNGAVVDGSSIKLNSGANVKAPIDLNDGGRIRYRTQELPDADTQIGPADADFFYVIQSNYPSAERVVTVTDGQEGETLRFARINSTGFNIELRREDTTPITYLGSDYNGHKTDSLLLMFLAGKWQVVQQGDLQGGTP